MQMLKLSKCKKKKKKKIKRFKAYKLLKQYNIYIYIYDYPKEKYKRRMNYPKKNKSQLQLLKYARQFQLLQKMNQKFWQFKLPLRRFNAQKLPKKKQKTKNI